jgi:pyruvate dehydrogenase E1 component
VKESWVSKQLRGTEGIVVSATDHMRAYSEQIRAYLPDGRPFVALGTDGYGRSDTRANYVVSLVLMLHISWLRL